MIAGSIGGHFSKDSLPNLATHACMGLQRWMVRVGAALAIDHLCECRDPPHHSKP